MNITAVSNAAAGTPVTAPDRLMIRYLRGIIWICFVIAHDFSSQSKRLAYRLKNRWLYVFALLSYGLNADTGECPYHHKDTQQ
jgi:hypothetical protein